ncbi:MAG: DNA polymerase III subunit beta [Opitutales bacterium]|nr:DNA polymerase III subunit beta [Opitutales bacterium]NRA26481.1 DNA polymerase III subunit beta [Opitutales bacterium]
MKFKINRDHFVNGLQQVLNVVSSRATMPILGNVLIEAEDGGIRLTTTNLDIGIRTSLVASVEATGAITLPVRKLATIVKELPHLDVFVEMGDKNAVQITSGGSRFKIVGISHDEFPKLPSFEDERSFDMNQDDLSKMIKSVSYAQSNDENRFILNGVFFNFADDKVTLVATDGRRLALVGSEMEIGESGGGSLILPAKTVAELGRLLGKGESVRMSFNDRQVAFTVTVGSDSADSGFAGDLYLVSKTVEGNYPNYRQVIPKETEHRIKVERELLLECVHRAALVTSEKNNSVAIRVTENLLEVSASSAEFGDSHESMAIAYDGPEVKVAFNPYYVMEPLRALTKDEVFFEFKDELSPGVFKTLESFLCVIMPLRLN